MHALYINTEIESGGVREGGSERGDGVREGERIQKCQLT